jgi:hypothetical protein
MEDFEMFDQAHGGSARQSAGVMLERRRSGSHDRAAIARVVLDELNRARPATAGRPITEASPLATSGIDDACFLDVVARIEGRYEMRFRDEWLRAVRTCADLVDCVTQRMFDAADRTASLPLGALPLGGQRPLPGPAPVR